MYHLIYPSTLLYVETSCLLLTSRSFLHLSDMADDKGVQYLVDNNVPAIINDMLKQLVAEKPKEILPFLANWCTKQSQEHPSFDTLFLVPSLDTLLRYQTLQGTLCRYPREVRAFGTSTNRYRSLH